MRRHVIVPEVSSNSRENNVCKMYVVFSEGDITPGTPFEE